MVKKMKPLPLTLPTAHRGFSLVELLVSVVIGMLGIVVMFQVLSLWDSMKRTTAAGSDAQVSGAVAMHNLERDIRPAGLGFGKGAQPGAAESIGCKVSAKKMAPAVAAFSSDTTSADYFSLVPVRIINGASGAADTVIVLYGNSSLFVSTQKFKASTTTTKTIDGSSGGFKVGDVVIAGGTGGAVDCEMLEVSSMAVAGVVGHATALRFNAAPVPTALTSGFLYNLGPLPQRSVWRIQNEKLYRLDSLYSDTAVEIADNIINLQAQYGVDGAGGGNATDGVLEAGDWTDTAPANWAKLLAIRIALLSRSQQFEKTEVTASQPAWSAGAFTMSDIPGASGDAANWKRYRYRVYEQVIPLRNMIWGALQ